MEYVAKRLAEQMIESYGGIPDDRVLIADLLEERDCDHDEQAVDAFVRYMHWLWEE